jgi:hypothetical protein
MSAFKFAVIDLIPIGVAFAHVWFAFDVLPAGAPILFLQFSFRALALSGTPQISLARTRLALVVVCARLPSRQAVWTLLPPSTSTKELEKTPPSLASELLTFSFALCCVPVACAQVLSGLFRSHELVGEISAAAGAAAAAVLDRYLLRLHQQWDIDITCAAYRSKGQCHAQSHAKEPHSATRKSEAKKFKKRQSTVTVVTHCGPLY